MLIAGMVVLGTAPDQTGLAGAATSALIGSEFRFFAVSWPQHFRPVPGGFVTSCGPTDGSRVNVRNG